MNKEYTTDECLQEYYTSLEEQLKEKDAMIDWLAEKYSERVQDCPYEICKQSDCGKTAAQCWREVAREAVKQND